MLQTEARTLSLPAFCLFWPTRLGWAFLAGKGLGVLGDAPGPGPSALALFTLCYFCPLNCVWLVLQAGFPDSQSHGGLLCWVLPAPWKTPRERGGPDCQQPSPAGELCRCRQMAHVIQRVLLIAGPWPELSR